MNTTSSVIIYTKPGCPYCAAAKKSFTDNGIAFTEFDVKSSAEIAEKARQLAGGKSVVPVIVENGQVSLGFGGA